VRQGELRSGWADSGQPSLDVLAMCYRDLVWPSVIVGLAGARQALAHCRATLMRGAAVHTVARRSALAARGDELRPVSR
jgi:hypothetical protein